MLRPPMRRLLLALLFFSLLGMLCPSQSPRAAERGPIQVLLLGDTSHHRPADFAKTLRPVLATEGIRIDFTVEVSALTPENLGRYDAVAIYRDSGDLPAAQEAALLEFVDKGKGLVAIHCASHCFRNSNKYTALVGGRFWKHNTGDFRARIIDAQHPALQGVKSFETWDETYLHNQVAGDIRVLMVRSESGGYEPYTWVRRQGKGRVYYTALGHDERTWEKKGFQKLLAQGIRWAAGRTVPRPDLQPFQYEKAKIPHYMPGRGRGGADPSLQMQQPLSPAESMKHMHLPEGFEIQLYAAEPDIRKPIAMAWDARGRLWIAETTDYPNDMQRGGQGRDRIIICEDTKGTGRADKFTVFADKLSIPTSLVFANGGVIVAQAPQMLFLKSSKGNGKADIRKVLFTGWGTGDTHSGPSNLRWGFDNWIWGSVGYSGFRGKVGGKELRFSQGYFRMKPDGSELEYLTSTSNNTWGLGFNETGQVFGSTANNQHSVYLGLPNRYFERVRGWYGQSSIGIEDHKKFHPVTDKIRQVDFFGGYTAACGHALYTARSFPKEYWNRAAFVCEPTGHLVHVDFLEPRGSSFVARDGYNILASDDEWTAPIMAEVGPDGALWVIDWYNYIVQHNPTPEGFRNGKGNAYVTPLRDKVHGRIYRIVYKGAKSTPMPQLDKASPKELVDALGHDNMWWRMMAQRLLVERDKKDVLPPLAAQAGVANIGAPASAMHALWAMHGLGAFASPKKEYRDLLQQRLGHPDAGVRQAAVEVLPRNATAAADLLAAKVLADADPHSRLQALLTLSEMPPSREAAEAVVAFLLEPRNATDRWLPLGAITAAARNDLGFLQAASRSRPKTGTERALGEAVQVVAGHFARKAPEKGAAELLTAIGEASPPVAEAILAGLAAGWPSDHKVKLDAKGEAALAALPAKLSSASTLQLAALVQRWGQQDKLKNLTASLQKALRQRLANPNLEEALRLAAARDLVQLSNDPTVATILLEQITPRASPSLVRGLLETLALQTSPEAGAALVQRWPELTPAARPTALAVLLRRAPWTRALLAGLEKGQVDKADLSIDQVEQLSHHPDKAIAAQARKVLATSGRLANPDREKVVQALMPLAKRQGNAAAGKIVFEKNCAKCHRFGDLGQTIGPDLTGVGVRSRGDILIDILDPNRSVEGNYRQYTIETKKGLVLTGLLGGETKTSVELLDSEGKKHVLLREDIDSLISSNRSLMPEGFEKLPEEELVSLLDFLTQRSRFFPLPLGKAATITTVRGMFYDRASEVERLVFKKWGTQTAFGVPFQIIDPRGGSIPNAILLYSPNGAISRQMPRTASVPCNAPVKTIHLLSGVSGWGYPGGARGSVSLIVRLHYVDGKTEDHPLRNGVHLADYIREVDVPESKLAFRLRGRQVRYLAIHPRRGERIDRIEFVKGTDRTAPLVMAVTVEARE